jgi:hypothetical protein
MFVSRFVISGSVNRALRPFGAGLSGAAERLMAVEAAAVTGSADDDPGHGSARSRQPSFTAVPEALTISMLLPTVS